MISKNESYYEKELNILYKWDKYFFLYERDKYLSAWFDAETATHGEWPIVGASPRLCRQHDWGCSAAWGLGAQNGGHRASGGPGGGTVTGKWSNLIGQLK